VFPNLLAGVQYHVTRMKLMAVGPRDKRPGFL
jgi:hypothetical protein